MKHITYADKSVLVGDEAADLLLEFAALVAKSATGETVKLRAYDTLGEEVEATFLLDSGASMMAESTTSLLPEPDNDDAVAHMRERMQLITSPPEARPEHEPYEGYGEEFEGY
ncbi:hypothetical protein GCM10027416_00770 [Okibacterium endophyticum]